jgi:hypothetical protein
MTMNEFFNWNDTGYVIASNWFWLLLAGLIGVGIGWWTCDTSADKNQ